METCPRVARFWKIAIENNFGADETVISEIRFFGWSENYGSGVDDAAPPTSLRRRPGVQSDEQRAKAMFDVMDTTKSGSVDQSELYAYLQQNPISMLLLQDSIQG